MPRGTNPNSLANLRPKNGGVPGNKGGTGRPKNAVVQACRLAFEERIPTLMRIADDEKATNRDRIMAIDKLGEFGGLKKIDITSDGESIAPTVTIAVTYADPVDPSETA